MTLIRHGSGRLSSHSEHTVSGTIARLGTATAASGHLQGIEVAYWCVVAPALFVSVALLDGWGQICAFMALVGVPTALRGGHVAHPWVWFPVFFAAYSLPVPLMVSLGLQSGSGYTQKILMYHSIALLSWLAASGSRVKVLAFPSGPSRTSGYLKTVEQVAWWFVVLLIPLTAMSVGAVLLGDYSSKRDVVEGRGTSAALGMISFFGWLTVAAAVMIGRRLQMAVSTRMVVVPLTCWASIAYLVTGERDVLLNFAFVSMLMFYDAKKGFKVVYLYGMAVAVWLVLPITQQCKAALIGSVEPISYDLQTVLTGEFHSAGRNLLAILESRVGFKWGQTFVWDLQRVLSSQFLGIESRGTAGWFNEVFRVEQGIGGSAGWGFSAVAEGYLNFGMCGVALIFAVMGIVTGRLYRARARGIFHWVLYSCYVPVVIYVLRADMATYVSQTLKVVCLPLLVIYVASCALRWQCRESAR